MGYGIMEIPHDGAKQLPDRFRDAGLGVDITCKPDPERPGIQLEYVRCTRGNDDMLLIWTPSQDKPDQYFIWFFVPWSWWPWVHWRRQRLLDEVLIIVQQCGGICPDAMPPS